MAGRGFRGTYHDGRSGEVRVAAHYGGRLTGRGADEPSDQHRACDVEVPGVNLPVPFTSVSGQVHFPALVEVKTDTYDPNRTPNAYMERWTVRPDGTRLPGGVWRAAADGLDAFVYLYARTGLALWVWDLPRAVHALESVADWRRWRRVDVVNPDGYAARGRLAPRVQLLEAWAGHSCTDVVP